MCVIVASKRGIKQPTTEQLKHCFEQNPHGAGYMFARDGKVTIHKGFMDFNDYCRSIRSENFTDDDPVVYHFRISTQAGVNPQMTHPFPLTDNRELCEELDLYCDTGIAHNGIIRMTSDYKETRFSDTVIFITDYMTKLIRDTSDLTDPSVLSMIEHLTNSKWAILNAFTEEIVTVGKFINQDGILFSNDSFKDKPKCTIIPPKKFNWDDYYNGYYGYYGKGV